MILYFSATGNSMYCAAFMASRTNDEALSINNMMKRGISSIDCKGCERLGIIAPVYDWDLAYAVAEFLEGLTLENVGRGCYVYGVFTCGSNAGLADETLRRILAKKGITLNAAFAVSMPDNYVPMFRTEGPEKKAGHLLSADAALNNFAVDILTKRNVQKMTRKPSRFFVWLVRKFFMPSQRKVKGFTVSDSCIGCGLCEKVCPMNIITLKDKRPVWTADRCACCLACLHRCPKQAINRGRSAKNGRYLNPNVNL